MLYHPSRQMLTLGLILTINVGAWIGTTVLGSAIFTVAPGELWDFIGSDGPVGAAQIGGALYWQLLLAPVFLVPLVAIVTFIACRRSVAAIGIKQIELPVSSLALFGLTLAGAAYCLYKMSETGHLTLGIFQSLGSYEANMAARQDAIDDLHFVFYAVTYAVIPLVSCLFFARAIKEGGLVNWIGVAINYLFFIFLVLSIYMKAPMMVFFMLMAATVILVRANWLYIAGLVLAALLTFAALQTMLGGASDVSDSSTQAVPADVVSENPADAASNTPADAISKNPADPASNKPVDAASNNPGDAAGNEHSSSASMEDLIASIHNSAASIPLNAAYRMASGYPFYIGMFSSPENRCGIQSNRIPLLPTPKCNLPAKVFKAIYPQATFITGMSPQGAVPSAYAAQGLPYAWAIMVVSGVSLGLLCAAALVFAGLIGTAIAISTCAYAYYLTQVPFFGALTYSHGLAFFLFPVFVLIVVGAATQYATSGRIAVARVQ